MKRGMIFFLFIGLTFVYGCADRIVSDCETRDTGVPGQVTTFQEIQVKVLTPSCATAGCHRGDDSPFGLDLSAGKSYANLVNVSSGQSPSLKLVLPGNSKDSYLMQVLEGKGGVVMPPAGKLNEALIDSIAAWIDRGAPNN